jgi:hypothetical protein
MLLLPSLVSQAEEGIGIVFHYGHVINLGTSGIGPDAIYHGMYCLPFLPLPPSLSALLNLNFSSLLYDC